MLLAPLLLAPRADAQWARRTPDVQTETTRLGDWVLVAPERHALYLMADPRGVESVDIRTGALRWRNREVSAPLLLHGDQILALAYPTGVDRALRLVMLDAASGRVVARAAPAELPEWVTPTIGEGLGYSFHVGAVRRGDSAVVTWTARNWYAGGAYPNPMPPPTEVRGSLALDLTSGQWLRVAADTLSDRSRPRGAVVVDTGARRRGAAGEGEALRVVRHADSAGTRVLLRRTRDGAVVSEILLDEATSGHLDARLSADGGHALVMRQLRASRPQLPVRYRLTLHTADGAVLARTITRDLPLAFTVVGQRWLGLYHWSGARRAGEPTSFIRASVLRIPSGTVVVHRGVRDLEYRGGYPP